MTFEQEMERFWGKLNNRQREYMESDEFYKAAVKEKNAIKAQELACEKIFNKKVMRKYVEDRVWEEIQIEIFGDSN